MVKLNTEAIRKAKILTIVFSVFLIGCFASARSSKPQPEPDGFRGIKWGTNISMLKDVKMVEQDKSSKSDLVWYIRKDDPLAIGKAKLENIFYLFWMGNFESVWIDFKGDENFETLKKELFERFGKVPESEELLRKTDKAGWGERSMTKQPGEFYGWWGNITEMALSYSKDRQKGTLCVNSRMIREERRNYEKESEKERRLKERGF
jgi:hypothetical protein